MTERKGFQDLPAHENPQFSEDGKEMYYLLKARYPKEKVVDLDNILNALCASLTYLMVDSVNRDDRPMFLQLIHKILSNNLDIDLRK